MYQYRHAKLLIFAGLVGFAALGGCREKAPEYPATAASSPSTLATLVEDIPAGGSIGPIEYGFAPKLLTRAEIQLDVPPGRSAKAWGTKLIPTARADMLGARQCRYGRSQRLQICTVEQEDGLAMAYLERPIGDYRQAFLGDGGSPFSLAPSSLAGMNGFRVVEPPADAGSEGPGIDYGFYPVGERTLLVVRRFSDSADGANPAISDVLKSLRISAGEH